jgi:hypothetical protein
MKFKTWLAETFRRHEYRDGACGLCEVFWVPVGPGSYLSFSDMEYTNGAFPRVLSSYALLGAGRAEVMYDGHRVAFAMWTYYQSLYDPSTEWLTAQ